MVDNKLKRFEDETENEYINRICSLKTKNQLTLSWRMLADFLNEQLDMNRSEKWYRTHYYNGDFEVNIENPSPEETMLMKIVLFNILIIQLPENCIFIIKNLINAKMLSYGHMIVFWNNLLKL